MIACISTSLSCNESTFWSIISRSSSLQYVSLPVLRFVPFKSGIFDNEWVVGKSYELKLYLFCIIPLGRHRIRLVKLDKKTNTIMSEESGLLAPVWHHTISFKQTGEKRIAYTDLIEIKAGLLTPVIWAFAHLFYRHRQKRWKLLLKQAA